MCALLVLQQAPARAQFVAAVGNSPWRMGKFAHFARRPPRAVSTPPDSPEQRKAQGLVKTLLERESVLAEMARLARRAAGGAGQVVLLRGEAGIGKTAVIDRFSRAVRPAGPGVAGLV